MGTKLFSDIITFTRASSATRVNSSGLVEAVSSNQPRFDYDPVTLQSKGLLIEEQRTNLLTYSEQFDNAAWGKTGTSVTPNTVVAPDGTLTSDKLVEDTSNGVHVITQAATISAGVTYVFSVYLKAAERSKVRVMASSLGSLVNVDLASGTLSGGSGPGYVSSSISGVGGGWYKVALTYTESTSGSRSQAIYLEDAGGNTSYQGNGTSGIYIWGAQLEAGAFPTSYIPTTTAAATRAADIATITGSNFSSWYNQTEGTLVAEADVPATVSDSVTRIVLGTSDGAFNNSMYLHRNASSAQMGFYIIAGGVNQTGALVTSNGVQANVAFKTAAAYAVNNCAIDLSGGAVSTDASALIPTMNALMLGNGNWSGATNWLNGHIRRITYYPRRLTDAELQALTA